MFKNSYVLHHILYILSPGNKLMSFLIGAAHFYFVVEAKYYFCLKLNFSSSSCLWERGGVGRMKWSLLFLYT